MPPLGVNESRSLLFGTDGFITRQLEADTCLESIGGCSVEMSSGVSSWPAV